MKLGTILLWGDDLAAFRRQARLADELGYDVVGVGDTPFSWHDMYVSLAVAAGTVARAKLGPMVTTPFLHHPVTTANAMSSLYDLTDGRAVLTLGAGASVVSGLGRPGATGAELRSYLLAVRALLRGEGIVWDGSAVTPLNHARPVPMYVSAQGPKSLRLAGELADGVVLQLGSSVALIEQSIAAVHEGARLAERDPADIDLWAMSFFSVADTRARAISDITAFLASASLYRLRTKRALDAVPSDVKDRVLELRRRYDPNEHVVVGGRNAQLVDELGLGEYLASISAIAGTPGEVRATVDELAARGISCLFCSLAGHAEQDALLRTFASVVGGAA
jgi:alkanesulfonate monooxygenase SsuD/methylene tetrahydromethanopterin reductase-like flavin-dependent oxidoreductase (luciferase family)